MRLSRLIHLDSLVTTAGWWVATRLLVLSFWMGPENYVRGDVDYYFDRMRMLFTGASPAGILTEYPTPVLWLLSLPYAISRGDQTAFLAAFMILLLALDATILLLLRRTARRTGADLNAAGWMWIAFVVFMGPIVYLRLDLLTAGCMVLAVVALGKPLAGAMAGAGAAIKLWPALMWPATMTDRRQAFRSTIAFLATGGVLAAASWAWAGWDRLVSPLSWQGDRGLQIESLWATPAMLAHLGDPASYPIGMSRYQAFEVSGPMVAPLLAASSWGTIVGVGILIGLYALWLRRDDRTPVGAGMLMIAATLIMIVTNKTFSPQYLIWLGGPLAAVLALVPKADGVWTSISATVPTRGDAAAVSRRTASAPNRLLGWTALWTLVLTAATQVVYPLGYSYLIGYADGPLAIPMFVLLVARNAGLACLTVWFIVVLARMLLRPTEPVDQ